MLTRIWSVGDWIFSPTEECFNEATAFQPWKLATGVTALVGAGLASMRPRPFSRGNATYK
jgi:hypothetical protein